MAKVRNWYLRNMTETMEGPTWLFVLLIFGVVATSAGVYTLLTAWGHFGVADGWLGLLLGAVLLALALVLGRAWRRREQPSSGA